MRARAQNREVLVEQEERRERLQARAAPRVVEVMPPELAARNAWREDLGPRLFSLDDFHLAHRLAAAAASCPEDLVKWCHAADVLDEVRAAQFGG